MKDIFLLDMDDTLLDFQHLERENLIGVLTSFGIGADEKTARRFHEINDSLWKALERGEIARPQIVTRRFELLFAELGVSLGVRKVADAYFNGLAEKCFPFGGMHAFLEELKARGKIYVTTNGASSIQRRHLRDAGILPYVSGVFISDEIGANKPSAEYCRYVAEHISDFEAERAVYVGDSITSDKLSAERMGADFILFAPRGIPEGYGGKHAETYEEVLKIIDET